MHDVTSGRPVASGGGSGVATLAIAIGHRNLAVMLCMRPTTTMVTIMVRALETLQLTLTLQGSTVISGLSIMVPDS